MQKRFCDWCGQLAPEEVREWNYSIQVPKDGGVEGMIINVRAVFGVAKSVHPPELCRACELALIRGLVPPADRTTIG